MAKKVERFYIHSTHCKYGDDPLRNAVVVKEEVCTIEDGKETWTPHLNIMRDPERLFYITLPQFRNHQFKKEFEDYLKQPYRFFRNDYDEWSKGYNAKPKN